MLVVGEARSGAEAVTLAQEHQPDVILMDLNLPDINGIEATRRIVRALPDVGVLVITMLDDDSVFGALRAGARGYLVKGSEGDDTLRAIHAVALGEAIFSPSVAQRVIRFFGRPASTTAHPTLPGLTERESEILHLVAQGLSNQAIAERLVIRPKTVRNQVSAILGKLQVADRSQAIVRARDAGMGQAPE